MVWKYSYSKLHNLKNMSLVPGFNITLKLFQIRPIIQEVFKLEHLIAGYEAMEKGNLSGKIVVDHSN